MLILLAHCRGHLARAMRVMRRKMTDITAVMVAVFGKTKPSNPQAPDPSKK